ncbi:MAG: cytochrome P450 [Myxococcales bacterium]|nr:cytochrome P450 [Myxococcales bacterium]
MNPRVDTPLPGPRGLPLVGVLPGLLREGVFEYVERAWRTHGDMFQLPTLGRQRIVVAAHPEAIERVVTRDDLYLKDRNYDPIRPLLGNGLITSSGELWVRQRKLIQPMFHRDMLRGYVATMARCVHGMLDRWDAHAAAGRAFDVHEELLQLTHQIVGLTLFGLDIRDSAAASAHAVMDGLQIAGERVNRAFSLPLAVPTPTNRRFQRAIRLLDRLVYAIIAEARRQPPAPDQPRTLLRLLLEARGERGEAMDDRQLRDELLTQYVAGQETSALTISWALYLLAGHDDMMQRARVEAAALAESPTLEQLDALVYTRMLLDEVLRLRPPAWALTRRAREADVLRGHPVPAGATVMFGIYFVHRHPDFWERPDELFPEHFTPERVKARHHHAYLPFSAGPRSCLGRRFAIYEVLLLLGLILRRFRVEVLPEQRVGMRVGATCQPDRPILARVHRI